MRISIYAEWNIVEQILLFKDEFPNLFNIVTKYSELCVNLSEGEIDHLLVDSGSIYDDFVKNSSGYHPISLVDYFLEIYSDPNNILDHPRAIFLLNIKTEDIKKISKSFGVLVMNEESLDDSILCAFDSKTILKSENLGSSIIDGWSKFLNRDYPPFNSLVISDNYLFENGNGGKGFDNISVILELLLPSELSSDFHLILLVSEPNKHSENEKWYNDLFLRLENGLISLKRPYSIVFEMVFSDTIHPRVIISNYFRIKLEVGFSLFRIVKSKLIQDSNDFEYETVFFKNEKKFGENIFEKNFLLLGEIKGICQSIIGDKSKRISYWNYRVLNNFKNDKIIKNRLVNSV